AVAVDRGLLEPGVLEGPPHGQDVVLHGVELGRNGPVAEPDADDDRCPVGHDARQPSGAPMASGPPTGARPPGCWRYRRMRRIRPSSSSSNTMTSGMSVSVPSIS